MHQSCPEPNEHFEMDKRNKEETNNDKGPIEKLRQEPIGYSVFKILAALCPIVFLVLAVLAAQLNGQAIQYSLDGKPDASSYGQILLNIIKVVSTVYPMVFSVLVAGALRSVALYLSERGTTLGRLEQLIGSSTVGSTIIIHARLRMLDVVGVLVVLLWALSPIGSQSALRMINFGTSSFQKTFWYRSSDSFLNTFDANAMPGIYMSALLSPYSVRYAGQDVYGNIKIPSIEYLEQFGYKTDHEDWIGIDQKMNMEYSGLLGVQTAGLDWANGKRYTYDFNMETNYFAFQCDIDPSGYLDTSSNYKNLGLRRIPFYFATVSTDLVRDRPFRDSGYDVDATPRTIQFVSLSENSTSTWSRERHPYNNEASTRSRERHPYNTTWLSCRVTTSHVETRNKCVGTKCQVSAIRRSKLAHTSPNRTRLDQNEDSEFLVRMFATMAGNRSGSANSTLTERFIFDSDLSPESLEYSPVSLWLIRPEILNTRLSLLFNTYWSCLMMLDTISGVPRSLEWLDPPPDAVRMLYNESYIPGKGGFPMNDKAPFLARTVRADVFDYDASYQINRIYFTVYVASATVLLIVACAGAGIQFLVLVPDMLGYVSSLTRDNPYAETIPVVTTLSGLERALQLKDQRVKIADVRPGEDVGHISFISSAWVKGSTQLERGRFYF